MDSSLIHLIPNLQAAYREHKKQRQPNGPPPPYSVDPPKTNEPSPPNQNQSPTSSKGIDLPLAIEILEDKPRFGKRVVLRKYSERIVLEHDTPYKEYLHLVINEVHRYDDTRDPRFLLGVAAEMKGRAIWLPGRDVSVTGRESWEEVLLGLREGRVRGLRVMLWRDGKEG